MKKIWIFNHYATKPDEPTTREYDIGRELIRKGHQVTIFASSFSHYKFKEKYLLSGEKWKKENYNGVIFIWIKTFPYKKNNWRRFVNMFSYTWRVFWIGKRMKERPDVIMGTCVHPFAVLSAFLLSRIKKTHFFFEVTDLWPQTLVDMGFLSSRNPLVFTLRLLEKFLYKKAEKIITLLPYANEYIAGLGISKDKIIWIPNGADLSRYETMKSYRGDKKENFIFMYLGIHSPYASLNVVLEAAEILQKEEKSNLKFVFVGEGSEKPNLIKFAQDKNLDNVEFRDMVPKDQVFKIMEEADVFISIIKDMPVLTKYGISSNKLVDYLAAGRPIIFSVSSKNNPVEEAGAGITIPPDNPKVFAETVKKIISLTPGERIRMGEDGKIYAQKNYDIKQLAEKFEKLLT